jgi:hypothetical protein
MLIRLSHGASLSVKDDELSVCIKNLKKKRGM